MRCAAVHTPGESIENLVVEERPDLHPDAGMVRARVHATALNRADLLQRRGLYPAPEATPPSVRDIPGLEFVGTIDDVGAGVERWVGGERVFGVVPGGGYASQVVAAERTLIEVPRGLDNAAAAAVPEAFMTAHDALVTQGALVAGERVLIHAVGSGVGTAAVQLATALGAEAVGTAGSNYKLGKVRELADFLGINYRTHDFVEKIEETYGPECMDIVLDVVGATYWQRNLRLLAERGRLILVGRLGGSEAVTPLDAVMRKRLRIQGTVMRTRSLDERAAVARAFERDVVPLLESGAVKPVIDSVFPFEEIHRATARMENNENVGKIVLQFD